MGKGQRVKTWREAERNAENTGVGGWANSIERHVEGRGAGLLMARARGLPSPRHYDF